MNHIAKGSFEIVMQAAPAGDGAGRVAVVRMLIDKQYSGDMVGQGQGEMLSAGNPAAGSAGYVAIEHVSAMLNGRSGSFALQHSGVMHAGDSQLTIGVVPGSGTGELTGLAGSCNISIIDGQHFYEVHYCLD